MANIIKLKDHDTVTALKEIYKKSKDEGQKTRLRAILALKVGIHKKVSQEARLENVEK